MIGWQWARMAPVETRPAATLIVTRPVGWSAMLRKLWIEVDGARIGGLMPEETLKVEILSGQHTIRSKMDWCTSKRLTFNVRPGDCVKVEAGVPDPFSGAIGTFLWFWTLFPIRIVENAPPGAPPTPS